MTTLRALLEVASGRVPATECSMSPRSRLCGPARQGGVIGLIAAFQTASRSATKFFQGYIGGRQRDEWRHITHHHRLASLVFGIRDGFFNHGGGRKRRNNRFCNRSRLRAQDQSQYPTMMAATNKSPASPMVTRLFMAALPFLLHHRLVTLDEITSQSGSYEQATIWLFEGSAANPKCHY